MGGIQIFPWWPLWVTIWVYRHFYQWNQYNPRWNFNLSSHGNLCLHQWLFSWIHEYSLIIGLICNWKNHILPSIGITHLLNTSNPTAPPQQFRILLLIPLLRSFTILIQSGHNWDQAPSPPAPNLSILFRPKHFTHTGLYALYNLQQHLIFMKVLLHMVTDTSKCHLLTPKDV